MGRIIPSFHRHLLKDYHQWVAVQYAINTRGLSGLGGFERTLPPIPGRPPSALGSPPPIHKRFPSPHPPPIHLRYPLPPSLAPPEALSPTPGPPPPPPWQEEALENVCPCCLIFGNRPAISQRELPWITCRTRSFGIGVRVVLQSELFMPVHERQL